MKIRNEFNEVVGTASWYNDVGAYMVTLYGNKIGMTTNLDLLQANYLDGLELYLERKW